MQQTHFSTLTAQVQKTPAWKVGLLVVVAVIAGWFLHSALAGSGLLLLEHKDLLAVPWPTTLELAGEKVPLETFYVRESWEKNFLVILGQDYQNILYLKRTQKYFPFIEAELAKRNMPDDLKYVAVAESGLLNDNTSSAGAAGLWQLMPATGQAQGLRVDEQVDERRNFEKATVAALDYLGFLREEMGSWTLAIASYNAGHNRISGALEDQGVKDYYDLYLNRETANYLFKILAIKQVLSQPEKYGYKLDDKDYFDWPEYAQKKVGAVENLATWAQSQKSNLRTLYELNPWLESDSLPEGTWSLKVPSHE